MEELYKAAAKYLVDIDWISFQCPSPDCEQELTVQSNQCDWCGKQLKPLKNKVGIHPQTKKEIEKLVRIIVKKYKEDQLNEKTDRYRKAFVVGK